MKSAGVTYVLALTIIFSAPAFGVASTRLSTAPRIDGRIDFREWPTAARVDFDRGFISIGNDRTRLYLLVDVLADRTADRRTEASEGDWIEVFFDLDGDGAITPDVDTIYTLLPESYDLRIQYFAAPDGSRHPADPERTYSSVAAGFGCFAGDGSEMLYLPPLAPTCAEHRVWEIAIDLDEVGQDPSTPGIPSLTPLKFGVVVHSENAPFTEEIPEGFQGDFSRMPIIDLASVPAVIADRNAEIQFDQEDMDTNGDGIVNDAIEITQAVQTRGNTLRLVAHKDTAARVYIEVQEDDAPQHVTVWLYGVRDNHDLPGSPLAAELWAPPHAEFPLRVLYNGELCDAPGDPCPGSGVQFGRDNLNHTANFLLPESWTEADGVTFEARARFSTQRITSRSVNTYFHPRKTPYYVVMPINEGTWMVPVLPADDAMDAAESYMETVYPVPRIDFQRWPYYRPFNFAPTPVDNAAVAVILDELIWFYDLLVANGVDPLPDQIFGYTVTSNSARARPVEPIHDICIDPGCGHVAAGNTHGDTPHGPRDAGYTVVAHEINHNIGDRDTWAAHVPCDNYNPDNADCPHPTSVDPEWVRLWEDSEAAIDPGYRAADIREFGFDTRLPWENGYDLLEEPYPQRDFTVVPPYFRELMSYMESLARSPGSFAQPVFVHSAQWTSPYRWERMFDVFVPERQGPLMGRNPPISPPTGPVSPRPLSAYISGQVSPIGTGKLNPIFVLPGQPTLTSHPAGTHTLAIYYRATKVPFEIRFTPHFVDNNGNQLEASTFRLNVPLLGGITRIVLRRGQKFQQVLDEILVSPHLPRLRITRPFGKTQWNGRQMIQWQAEDKDGDALHYAIVYSPNAGRRWVPVAWGIEGTEWAVDMDLLPGGGTGRFKVIASDGFNTVSALSQGVLQVNDKPPTASILQPAAADDSQQPNGAEPSSIRSVSLSPGRVVLEAHGSDLEDGVLDDEAFLWFVGKERASLGRGRRVAAHMDSGLHLITLVVVDSAGNRAEKMLSVSIAEPPEEVF